MKDCDHVLQNEDYGLLANKLDGYSGADIQSICMDGHIRSQLKVFSAKRFRKVINDELHKLNRTIWNL